MIYPDPGIGPKPPPSSDDEPDAEEASLGGLFRRNGLWMGLVVVVTLGVLGVWAAVRPVRSAEDGQRLVVVQLWVMAVLMPIAAHGVGRTFDALYRAGVADDAFGVFMVVFAFVGGPWGVWDAVKLYLLVSAVGLLLIGLLAAVRCTELPAIVATGVMAAAGCALAGYHTLAVTGPVEFPDALSRINLVLAAGDAMGIQAAPVWWVVTFLIYGAAAGLWWSWLLIAGPPAGADEEGD
jgi:hypothetical protein